jgi:hypothetical protein
MWLILFPIWLFSWLFGPGEVESELPTYGSNSSCTVHVLKANAEEAVHRMRITDSSTVLDIVASIRFPPDETNPDEQKTLAIRLHRRRPGGSREILPVDWRALTQDGSMNTNFVIFPDDEMYIQVTADEGSN